MTLNKTQLNPWLVLAVMCVPVFIGALDLTVVSAFLPELIVELELPLQTALDDAAWILSGYLLAYTVSMTFMGRVSDLIGRVTVRPPREAPVEIDVEERPATLAVTSDLVRTDAGCIWRGLSAAV